MRWQEILVLIGICALLVAAILGVELVKPKAAHGQEPTATATATATPVITAAPRGVWSVE